MSYTKETKETGEAKKTKKTKKTKKNKDIKFREPGSGRLSIAQSSLLA